MLWLSIANISNVTRSFSRMGGVLREVIDAFTSAPFDSNVSINGSNAYGVVDVYSCIT